MQAIAREMNLSETAFVRRSSIADVAARYFTPVEEIPLAGHPTLSTTRALIEAGRLSPGDETITYSLELRDGPVGVAIAPGMNGGERIITMTQRRPVFGRLYDPAEVLPIFGLGPDDLLPGAPIQTVSTGTPQLMIPLCDRDGLERIRVDVERYTALRTAGGFFSPHCFALGGFTDTGDTCARHPGVPPDAADDPFTGSATGGMGAFLWHHGLIDSPSFIAEQGHMMGRPGRAFVEVTGDRENIESVHVGGETVMLLRGELVL
jgi:trans-2,3-dihydro-3-hydroxyanthranilate isomerase